jgi:hypothetical protein
LINSEYRQKAAIAMSDAISRSLLMIAPFWVMSNHERENLYVEGI